MKKIISFKTLVTVLSLVIMYLSYKGASVLLAPHIVSETTVDISAWVLAIGLWCSLDYANRKQSLRRREQLDKFLNELADEDDIEITVGDKPTTKKESEQ